ncbi:MAG: flagellin [Proteobacteria bacterium]|nr:flagellin [Pseudomonadota bacterium]
MGLRIKTNVPSLIAQRRLGITTADMQSNMEKLASGQRINKSADDAAGLAISETLTGKIRSMGQAKRNANDGISMIQVAEGSMNEISNILIRMRELATQSASDTLGNLERSYTNKEYTQLVQEIDRISNSTEFNGLNLLGGAEKNNGVGNLTIHVGAGDGKIENTDTINIDIDSVKINTQDVLKLNSEAEIGPIEVGGDFSREIAAEKLSVIDDAIKLVAGNRATLGAKQSRLNSTINNLGVQIENMSTSRSRIRDVDFAEVTAEFTQNRILGQAGTSVLAQASAIPELALKLL